MRSDKWPTREELRKMSLTALEALQKEELPTDVRGHVLLETAHQYNHAGNSPEKIPQLLDEALAIGNKLNDGSILIYAHGAYGWYFMKTSNYINAFEHMQTARQLAVDHKDNVREQGITKTLAALFSKLGLGDKAVDIQKEVYKWENDNDQLSTATCSSLGAMLANNDQYEEALAYYQEALRLEEKTPVQQDKLILLENLSIAYLKLERYEEAQAYANELEQWATTYKNDFFLHRSYHLFAALYRQAQKWEASFSYGQKAFAVLAEVDWLDKLVDLSEILMKGAAALGKHDMAYTYAEKFISFQKQLGIEQGKRKVYQFEYHLESEKKEREFDVRLANTRLKTLAMLANEMAHEIQNPLQFVNNFSEVNLELLDDLEQDPKDTEAITDLRINCQKINEHGKRISKIVAELQEKTQKAKAGELELGDVDEHDFSGSHKL